MQDTIWWSLGTVDFVVQATILGGAALAVVGLGALLFIAVKRRLAGSSVENFLFGLGVVGGVVAVFVAYATLRNQTRLTAEIALNEDAARIAEWERSSYPIRCTYTWFDRKAPAGYSGAENSRISNECLALIVANREIYTDVLLYIEEMFFLLQQANRDQNRWRSSYAEEIDYWREDVSDDPTGLFAFHLVYRYPLSKEFASLGSIHSGPKEEMAAAGVRINNLCGRAERVIRCLEAVGRYAEPLPKPFCASHTPLAANDPLIVGVASACRAASERARQLASTGVRAGP